MADDSRFCQSELLKELYSIAQDLSRYNQKKKIVALHVILTPEYSGAIPIWDYTKHFNTGTREALAGSGIRWVWFYRELWDAVITLDKRLVRI